jgi:DNA-binding response OmpR family regulator
MRTLVVDDDRNITAALDLLLRDIGYTVDVAFSVAEARSCAASGGYDLLVLDLNLPDGSGIDFATEYRSAHPATPILMLTAESAEEITVRALDAGADDFVTKPVRANTFLARVRALLRRSAVNQGDVLESGNLRCDRLARAVTVAGKSLRVTPRELALLESLMLTDGESVSRSDLLRRVFGMDVDPGTNIVEVNIGRMRSKLAGAGATVRIETWRGVGYALVDAAAPAGESK